MLTMASYTKMSTDTVVQRGQPDAGARALDADGDDPEPVRRRQGVPGIRRGRTDEAVLLLRPRGRRNGGAGEIHAADPRPFRLPRRPLQRAQGSGREGDEASRRGGHEARG